MVNNDPLTLHPDSPSRVPAWRWLRAAAVVAGKRKLSRKREDPATCKAVAFIRASRKVVTERAQRRIFAAYPDLFTAGQLYQDASRRLEIESHVLARQAPELIAELMSVPLQTVLAYQTYFFDIADRIDATGYVTQTVIGLTDPATAPPHVWLKALAYHHGPAVIEPFLDFLDHASENHDLGTEVGRQREAIAIFLAVVQWLDLRGPDVKRLQKSATMILAQERKTANFTPVSAIFAAQGAADGKDSQVLEPRKHIEQRPGGYGSDGLPWRPESTFVWRCTPKNRAAGTTGAAADAPIEDSLRPCSLMPASGVWDRRQNVPQRASVSPGKP